MEKYTTAVIGDRTNAIDKRPQFVGDICIYFQDKWLCSQDLHNVWPESALEFHPSCGQHDYLNSAHSNHPHCLPTRVQNRFLLNQDWSLVSTTRRNTVRHPLHHRKPRCCMDKDILFWQSPPHFWQNQPDRKFHSEWVPRKVSDKKPWRVGWAPSTTISTAV